LQSFNTKTGNDLVTLSAELSVYLSTIARVVMVECSTTYGLSYQATSFSNLREYWELAELKANSNG
jgi:hypothetical protein